MSSSTDPFATGPLPRITGREASAAHRVLDLALRMGDVLLSGGASASEVTASCIAVGEAGGLQRVECDITFTSITVTGHPGADTAPVSGMRLVHQRSLDYSRVTTAHNLVRDLVENRIGVLEADRQLRAVVRARHPYPGIVVTAARAALVAAVAVLLGAGLLVTAVAFAATVAIDLAIGRLARGQLPVFFQNAAGGLIATVAALALYASDTEVRPSLVVAACIVLLLPGVTLVGAVQDAITGFYVTASARAFETFLLTAGILSGIAVALSVGVRAGLPVRIGDPPIHGLEQVPWQLLAAAVVSMSFAVSNYAPRRTLVATGLLGMLGWGAFVLVDRGLVSPPLASAAGATLIGIGAYAFAAAQRVPALVYVAAGIIPLLPGLAIYRGMLRFVGGDSTGGITLLGQAVTVGLALAAGALLGAYIAHGLRRGDPRQLRRLTGLVPAGRRRRRQGAAST